MTILTPSDSLQAGRAARNLRRVLFANAATSAAAGLVLAVLPHSLAGLLVPDGGTLLGLDPAGWLLATGLGLIVFAILVAIVAAPARPKDGFVTAIVAADLGWVVGSALLLALAGAALTWPAWILVILVADMVAVFAWLQSRFLRASGTRPVPAEPGGRPGPMRA